MDNIEKIIKLNRNNDYHEMSTGKIFRIPLMMYFKALNITIIPVSNLIGEIIDYAPFKGDLTKI